MKELLKQMLKKVCDDLDWMHLAQQGVFSGP
jgi:hypothetical protein